ncbi:hypothetical protein [Brevibacterium casei]|uniref:Uncharacterized protein n=1 Tax=Brevibacterium casei TaxID=33889 RepID=A0A269Z6W2_9MICO|nr:hypothetical protein AVP41_01278 [Microbacterium sp. TNHR37B]MCJ2194669.1 hypothetical protein [Kaistella montana]NYF30109.1 hypothetical protein [Microbacterium sp. JAI119]PAK93542.1 hypothetical protein B8X04_15355 [Brevibacterium casei]
MRLFAIRDIRHLFGAQITALFGTGLATVALGLLAYDLAGPSAGPVLAAADPLQPSRQSRSYSAMKQPSAIGS